MNKKELMEYLRTRSLFYANNYNDLLDIIKNAAGNLEDVKRKIYIKKAKEFFEKYENIHNDYESYKELLNNYRHEQNEEQKKHLASQMYQIEKKYEEEYNEVIKKPEEDKNQGETFSTENNNDSIFKKGISWTLGLCAGAALVFGITSCEKEKDKVSLVKEQEDDFKKDSRNQFASNFTDIKDKTQVLTRANEYADLLNKIPSVASQNVIDVERIANCIMLMNGVLPEEYGEEELAGIDTEMNYIISLFVNKVGNEYVPFHGLFVDGSDIQRSVLDLDDITKKISSSIKNGDTASFVQAGKEYGVYINQHLIRPDVNMDFYKNDYKISDVKIRSYNNVPSIYASAALANTYYGSVILPAGISNGTFEKDSNGLFKSRDICFPVCIDHATGELENMTLADEMYLYNFIPINELDAVVARSEIGRKENDSHSEIEDTLPEHFHNETDRYYSEIIEFRNRNQNQKKLTR